MISDARLTSHREIKWQVDDRNEWRNREQLRTNFRVEYRKRKFIQIRLALSIKNDSSKPISS